MYSLDLGMIQPPEVVRELPAYWLLTQQQIYQVPMMPLGEHGPFQLALYHFRLFIRSTADLPFSNLSGSGVLYSMTPAALRDCYNSPASLPASVARIPLAYWRDRGYIIDCPSRFICCSRS